MAQGEDVVPIPGTKRRSYLEENVGACDVRLDDADLRRLDELAPVGVAAGGRYLASTGMRTTYGDSPLPAA
jgi:diketogulonate reductase-like aldo/keto reductase